MRQNKKGQMIIEYAIMFVVIVAVILVAAMTLIKPSVNKVFVETAAAINKVADSYVQNIIDY